MIAVAGLNAADAKKRKRKKKENKPVNTPDPRCNPLGSVSVPGTGASVQTPVLLDGQRYRLRATGFWNSNATHWQDTFADFAVADPNAPVTTFQGVRLGLSVDGGSPDQWGSDNSGHTYEMVVTGRGAALSLRCSDAVRSDNSGSVNVEILCA